MANRHPYWQVSASKHPEVRDEWIEQVLGETNMTTSDTSSGDAQRFPLPVYPRVTVHYDPETDILTLGNGAPASNGSNITEDLMVFYDEEDEPQMVVLEDAAKLLRPYLFPGRQDGSSE